MAILGSPTKRLLDYNFQPERAYRRKTHLASGSQVPRTILDIASQLRTRKLSPVELTKVCLARIEKLALRGLADPGATLAILGGILLVLSNRQYYVHALWLHIKLVFVLLLIVLHVIVGTRSKAYAAERISLDRGYVRLLAIVIVLVFTAVACPPSPSDAVLVPL